MERDREFTRASGRMFARVNSRETHALNEKKTVEEKRGEREWGDVIAPNRAHRENERERERKSATGRATSRYAWVHEGEAK